MKQLPYCKWNGSRQPQKMNEVGEQGSFSEKELYLIDLSQSLSSRGEQSTFSSVSSTETTCNFYPSWLNAKKKLRIGRQVIERPDP